MKKPLLFGIILTVCVVIVAYVFSLGYPGGMISYWKLDEVDGITAVDSVDANDGILNLGNLGNTDPATAWTIGKVGGALSFDGLDDHVTIPSNGLSSNPMTISWWMNTNDMMAALFLDKNNWYDPQGMEIWLYNNSDGYGYLNVRGSGRTNVASSSDFHGEWVHVAVVFDGTTAKIYRNGAFDTSGTIEQVTTSAIDVDFIMGMLPGLSDWYLNGIIDEVAIYNRVLSAEEIQQHYENGSYEVECFPPPDGMVSWWPGDRNADDIVGGNTGTLEGGATFDTGKVGDAFSLDGFDDYVQLPAFGSFTQFTVDAWIKRTGTTNARETIVSYKEGETIWGPLNDGFVLSLNENGNSQKPRLWVDVDDTWRYTEGLEAIPLNSFIHIAGSYDGNNLRLYVNGELVASTLAPGSMTQSDQVSAIGSRATDHNVYPHFFPGIIDEVEIFDHALSQLEIQDIYLAGSAGKCKFIEVDIDIKPGSDPNSINLGERGLLPVAILGSANFDVTEIDPETIAIGGISLASRGKKGKKLAYSYEDVDPWDENIDMMVFFDVQDLVEIGVLAAGTNELLLTANLKDGTPLEGTDFVNIVN